MATAKRPTAYLSGKTNVIPSIDRMTEATAADFKEIADILSDHAMLIDQVNRTDEASQFYGFFTSLDLVAAQYPNAPEDSFAVIDPGNGNPQQIAKVVNGTWTLETLDAPIQFYATKTDRPAQGQTGVWYIVKDEKIAYLWYDGKYNGFGKDGANGMSAYEIAVAVKGFTGTEEEWLESLVGPQGPPGTAVQGSIHDIYKENAGTAGGEWDFTDATGGKVNPDSTTSVFEGTKALELTALGVYSSGDPATDSFKFTPESFIEVPEGFLLKVKYHIKNKTNGGKEHQVRLMGARHNSEFISGEGKFASFSGYDPNSLEWQEITIDFTGDKKDIRSLTIGAAEAGFSAFIDNISISIESNVEPKLPEGDGTEKTLIIKPDGTKEWAGVKFTQEEKDKLAALNGTAPVAYATMADMYAAQGNQVANGSYRVDDASGHPDVDAGRAWFDFKGATYGDHRDYILRSEEESLNLDAQLTAIENRLTALENAGGVITVASSRALAATDSGNKLLVTAPVTLTWPSGGITGFECNFDIDAGGQLTIAEGTAGEVDAPDGKILEAGKMGHAYRRPDTGKLRLKGTWTV